MDGTLLRTVEALLGSYGPDVLTPVTLWELTAFIDALVCFDRLYSIATPVVDVSQFNRRLGANVMAVIPDPDGGMLRRLAAQAAANALSEMWSLRGQAAPGTAWGQELQAVVDGWRAVLGRRFPSDGPFDINKLDIRLVQMERPAYTGDDPEPRYDPHSDLSAVLIDGPAAPGRENSGDPRHGQLWVLVEATRLPHPGGPSQPPADAGS